MATMDIRQIMLIVAGYVLGLAVISALHPAPLLVSLLIAVTLPTAAAANYKIFQRLGRRRNGDADPTSWVAVREIGFRISLFNIALHLLILGSLTGLLGAELIAPARLVVVFFGLLLIGISNLLPRTRPNLAVGIRTPLTLENRDAWIGVHRVAGSAGVAFGIVIVIAGTFLRNPTMPQVISAAAWTAMAILVATYRRHSRRRSA